MNPSSLDTSQAPPMPAIPKDRDKDDANRAISSSGSSKPSVMSYDGRSTPEQTPNSRDVQSPQRQQQQQQQQSSSTSARRGGSNNNNNSGSGGGGGGGGGSGSSSRGHERQGRDKDGNPLPLRLNDRERKEHSASPTSTHILVGMKGDGTNNVRKNPGLNDRNNATNNDESKAGDPAMTDDGSEIATVEEPSLKAPQAPQISPMKPLSPMGVEIDLEIKSGDDS